MKTIQKFRVGLVASLFVLGSTLVYSSEPEPTLKRFAVYKETNTGTFQNVSLSDSDIGLGLSDRYGARSTKYSSLALKIVDLDDLDKAEASVTYSNRPKYFYFSFAEVIDEGGSGEPQLEYFFPTSYQSCTIPVTVGRKGVPREFYHYAYNMPGTVYLEDEEGEFIESYDGNEFRGFVANGQADLTNFQLPLPLPVGLDRLVSNVPRVKTFNSITSSVSLNYFEEYVEDPEDEENYILAQIPGKAAYRDTTKSTQRFDNALTSLVNGKAGALLGNEGESLEPGTRAYAIAAIKKHFMDRNFQDLGN
jgi:hypothetical protein